MTAQADTETAPVVPTPTPPDAADAWYAPDVREQDEVYPGVVVTVRRGRSGFRYDVRDPVLSASETDALSTVESHFAGANIERPRTREGAVERMNGGFDAKHRRVIDRLVDASPASRRRVEYHALSSLACFDDLTPYALDSRIDVADVTDDGVVVHTDDYAPAETDLGPDPAYLNRFASERVERHTVRFQGFEIPVVVYREHLLGADPFTTKYAVREPDLLPGDEQLIEVCKERVWETGVDGVVQDRVDFVRERARSLLARQLTVRNTTEWVDAARYRLRSALAELDLAVPPVDHRFADDRLDDLLYYVLRDLVGYGKLTVPIRDHTLEDIEANRVDERVKVLPRADLGHDGRVPTNLAFDSEAAFVNVVTQLAADDGVELNASNPSAKVNIDPDGDGLHDADDTIRCAVALPTISEGGPHISIRKQSGDAMTPVDLVQRDSLPTELVALLWLLYESHGVVLFSGPTGAGKTTLMNAHMPFIPYRDRPISIDEGSREVRIPHETGVSLTTRDHERDHRRVTMADLMTQCNYLNPDIEVIAEINTAASFETFAETLNTGHGVIGTTHAGDIESLVNRVIEKGLPTYLLEEIDLVVFPRHVDGERYVGEVVEFVNDPSVVESGNDRSGTIHKDGTTIHWNSVCWRRPDGNFELAYDHPQFGDDRRQVDTGIFDRLSDLRDEPVSAVEDAFHRRHRYVQYLVQEGLTDFDDLFGVLADLETNEAATVERLRRQAGTPDSPQLEVGTGDD
ncbi:type IV secretory pathway ATPase VirB11/archaellum biosynthesis ATPase [Haloarcula quadrata]|nr:MULTISPECIES: type II/IV secretion system ATPase subunit [Haloarcula]QCP91529.1 secretion system protein [Haloarcula marismortui ATCC 43049]RKS81866.1 type IV secretory pathway ATPase VirB11/archaellum biosynthesis ATPase [Haloarcula quadrata]